MGLAGVRSVGRDACPLFLRGAFFGKKVQGGFASGEPCPSLGKVRIGSDYFAQQVAASLHDRVDYHEINLAKCDARQFEACLGALNAARPGLCLVDEIDAKPREVWPYEMLLPYLDEAVDRGAQFVFVLAGSSGSAIADMKERMASRPKGSDLLSRIPSGNEYEIGPMGLGDRVLVVLTQLRQAGSEAGNWTPLRPSASTACHSRTRLGTGRGQGYRPQPAPRV